MKNLFMVVHCCARWTQETLTKSGASQGCCAHARSALIRIVGLLGEHFCIGELRCVKVWILLVTLHRQGNALHYIQFSCFAQA